MSGSIDSATLLVLLRIVGLSHMLLGVAHVPIWKLFDWTNEIAPLSPLTRRVFAVHTFFIVFVLVALGTLTLVRPELLLTPTALAQLLLGAGVTFWALRLLAQVVVFDPVLLPGTRYGWLLRRAATLLFSIYVLVYGLVLSRQLG